jgi:trans-2,3-dihydro-3-hydroxyanthranilate isomerase
VETRRRPAFGPGDLIEYPYVVLDVFTDRALAGNQLAVFTAAETVPEQLRQPLAREMNFSETVFLEAPVAGGHVRVRIFTPTSEIPFAGHPVLGAAVLVATTTDRDLVNVETGGGVVPVRIESRTAATAFGRMRQPLPTVTAYPDSAPLLAALGLAVSELPVEVYDNGIAHVYVACHDVATVVGLDPDMAALARLARASTHPLMGINCFGGSGRAWTTRMFCPADGIPEDPATGSAAGPLACHLARYGWIAFDEEITISQGASIGRPSTLYARAEGSRDAITGVEVAGSAVIVARGVFSL